MDRNLSLAARAARADPHRLIRSLDNETREHLLEALLVYQQPSIDQLAQLLYRLDLDYPSRRRLVEAITDWRRVIWVRAGNQLDRLDLRTANTDGLRELLRLHRLSGIAPPGRRVRLQRWQVDRIEQELEQREQLP